MSSVNLFIGTASYYAAFRPRYPRELIDLLAAAPPGLGRLVDLGCGTGELARPLAGVFEEVVAVDSQPDMIEVGTNRAVEEGIDNIVWVVGKAESVDLGAGSTDLITVGSAFHWMDRPLVLDKARRSLGAEGVFAVVGGNSPWTGKEPWQQAIVFVLESVLGPNRRAGDGVFRHPKEPHEIVLARHGFSDVVQHEFWTPHEWTLDGILGYLRSTSFASRAVLDDKADEFERALTTELLAVNPSGTFSEILPFYTLISHPDGEQA